MTSSVNGATTDATTAFDAVLWDMDGTLVDTEPYWIQCEHELVSQHGNGQWTDDHAHALVGFDLRDAARYISTHGAVDLPVDDIVNLLLDGVIERVRRSIPWRPGARELLADLRRLDVPCALVTMSWRRFAQAVIDQLPPGSFQAVVVGDDVTDGKPHPEPYLTAARLLGVAPERCVAIEDSPTGVRSAVAAGCMTIGVAHVVTIPSHLGHRRLDSLDGMLTKQLAAFVAA
ncbi:MAG: hydrolase [Ilumatobacteraceae bacterium]|nr:hydrolase [Ilumatobacteraceae bacterium]